VKFYDSTTDSANMVSRGFCPNCGSIYSTNSPMPGMTFLRASSLDNPDVFRPQMVVYTDRAAKWDYMDRRCPPLPRCRRRPLFAQRAATKDAARSPTAALQSALQHVPHCDGGRGSQCRVPITLCGTVIATPSVEIGEDGCP
jgi:hypothetical protein